MTSDTAPRPALAAPLPGDTADHNHGQIRAMFDNLAVLAEGPGLTWGLIAERAGTTPELAKRIIHVGEDITISDLEVILAAVGVRIWIETEPDS